MNRDSGLNLKFTLLEFLKKTRNIFEKVTTEEYLNLFQGMDLMIRKSQLNKTKTRSIKINLLKDKLNFLKNLKTRNIFKIYNSHRETVNMNDCTVWIKTMK